MSSNVELCINCKQIKSLDIMRHGEEGWICNDCEQEPEDLTEVLERDNVLITKFISAYCLKKKFNPAKQSAFLEGLQMGIGLARAIRTNTLDTFTQTQE